MTIDERLRQEADTIERLGNATNDEDRVVALLREAADLIRDSGLCYECRQGDHSEHKGEPCNNYLEFACDCPERPPKRKRN